MKKNRDNYGVDFVRTPPPFLGSFYHIILIMIFWFAFISGFLLVSLTPSLIYVGQDQNWEISGFEGQSTKVVGYNSENIKTNILIFCDENTRYTFPNTICYMLPAKDTKYAGPLKKYANQNTKFTIHPLKMFCFRDFFVNSCTFWQTFLRA